MCDTQIKIVLLFLIVAVLFLRRCKFQTVDKRFFVAIMVIMILTVVFRNSTIADYDNYYNSVVFMLGGDRFEPTYHIIRYISNLTFFPWEFFCLAYASVSVVLRMKYIRNESSLIWGSMLVYISNIFITQDMIAIRASAASAILLYSLKYNMEDNKKYMLLTISLAAMFHYSALLFLFLLFIDGEKKYRLFYVLLLLGSYILAITGLTFGSCLSYLNNDYLTNNYVQNIHVQSLNIFNLVQMGHVLICLLAWLFLDVIIKKDNTILLYLKVYTIGLALAVLFSDFLSVALRMSELMLSIDVIFIPIVFSSLFNNILFKKLSILSYCMVVLIVNLTSANYWLGNV